MPPKKKYRISHRKSTEDVIVIKTINVGWTDETLKLECGSDDLSPAQQQMYIKVHQEEEELKTKLENYEQIYKGNSVSAYAGNGSQSMQAMSPQSAGVMLQQKGNAYQLVMDPRLGGFLVGTMTPTGPPPKGIPAVVPVPQPMAQPAPVRPPVKERRRGRPPNLVPAPPAPVITVRPTENTSIGGLTTGTANKQNSAASSAGNVVDLTDDDRPLMADSREISFNKLQGKTFPSLVVVARPHLRVKEGPTGDRSKLDGKVKGVLMHVPTKFTEWLIQQGMVRSEQTCGQHPATKLKLGMYSDVSKFPYSGGYVWISECCPQRFVSVFSGSLFEGSPHAPSVLLKLIYHWSCQTNVQNVVQWVKVDNLYVKGLNQWLRAACTVALHTHISPLGGPGRRVEVGVISLGTTSQDGHQRQVKVEVLGLLETDAKLLRLRAVEPLADNDKNYRRRFTKILEPLREWVHPDSIIVTDLTVDKLTLQLLGFTNVIQSSGSEGQPQTNQTIMEYLRRIVPRMFQNTLSLLSRQIIQQFLDELVWREWFGVTAAQAFDNIITHIAEQTRYDSGHPLIMRLNKVATNPFKYWGLTPQHLPSIAANNPHKTYSGPNSTVTIPPAQQQQQPEPTPSTSAGTGSGLPKRSTRKRQAAPVAIRDFTPSPEPQPPPPKVSKAAAADAPEQCVPVDNYYYGSIEGRDTSMEKIALNIKCSSCKAPFTDNIKLMDHLLAHAHNVSGSVNQCRYCLASVASAEGLKRHINDSHPCETRAGGGFVCVICEIKFPKSNNLGKHMSREHVSGELPYLCGGCGFRCSSHRHAIDHFYSKHKGEALLQCPFCLKTMSVVSGGRMMGQQTTFYLQHLQKHQKKIVAKKCTKCALWFIQKEALKEHLVSMHTTVKGKTGFVPWKPPRDVVMVPKSKKAPVKESLDVPPPEARLTYDLSLAGAAAVCLECNLSVAEDHFQAHESCFKCQYSTLCKLTMSNHLSSCARQIHTEVPPLPLAKQLHCVCGYNSLDGNQLARHLTQCERKSAYPTEAAAKAATVTHSMLDVLGLVRRPEEPPAPADAPPAAVAAAESAPATAAADDVIDIDADPEVVALD